MMAGQLKSFRLILFDRKLSKVDYYRMLPFRGQLLWHSPVSAGGNFRTAPVSGSPLTFKLTNRRDWGP